MKKILLFLLIPCFMGFGSCSMNRVAPKRDFTEIHYERRDKPSRKYSKKHYNSKSLLLQKRNRVIPKF